MITKGNWEADYKEYDANPKIIYTGIKVEIEPNYYQRLFDTILPDSDKDYIKEHKEIEANINLVCAAPEMLNVLVELMSKYDKDGHLLNFDVSKARNVILKSHGVSDK